MLKLPFALQQDVALLEYPFKIKQGNSFVYRDKNYNSYIMYIDNLDIINYKEVYEKFVKNKCIGRTIPTKLLGTMKLKVNLTDLGLKNFYLFNAKFIKYLKALGITKVIPLSKKELKELAYKDLDYIYNYLLNNYSIATNTEIDLGKTTLSSNSLLLANIYLKIVNKCNKGVDFGTDFYEFIDTLQLNTREKMLINKRLEKIDNSYFYVFKD